MANTYAIINVNHCGEFSLPMIITFGTLCIKCFMSVSLSVSSDVL